MITVGIIGCGYWGPNLLRNFHHNPRSKALLACDLRQDRLDAMSALYPSLQTTHRPEDVLTHPGIDAVAISTPVSTHFELAKKALENGKHVLLEKPMTATVEEGQELIALALRHRKVLLIDHTFIYTGAVKKMKEIISSGDIGKLYYFDSVRVNLGLFQHDVNVLWDLAPHDLAIMDHLIGGKVIEVTAEGTSHFDSGLENIAYITVYFDDGVIGHVHVNWLAPVKVRQTLIGGAKKMIVYNDMENVEKLKVYDRGVELTPDRNHIYHTLVQYRTGDMWAPRLDQTEALTTEVAHFLDCIEHGAEPLSGGESGLRIVEILAKADACLERRRT